MARYINADELIFFGFDNPDDDHLFEFVPKEFIDNAPTADVREVVHGEWIDKGDSNYYCSECDFPISNNYRIDVLNFCPHCGANMDGREEEDDECE